MTKLENPNGIPKVETGTLTIPAKPATVIPETPAQEIKLPVFIKKKEPLVGNEFIRIDSIGKFVNVWMNQYNSRISVSDYGNYMAGDAKEFTDFPERFKVISETEFNEAFATAHTAIGTALGLLVKADRPPDPDDFDDTDYSSAADEEMERRTEQWLEEMESSRMNPDDEL